MTTKPTTTASGARVVRGDRDDERAARDGVLHRAEAFEEGFTK
jgi:hypothetical protein